MLDTVILAIQGGSLRTISGSHIPAWTLHSQYEDYSKRVKVLTSSQKRDGVYRPRITGIKRGKSRILKVEFSVPKILHGNNLAEISENDFESIVRLLQERLAGLGIIVSHSTIKNAEVTGFHPSKNIVLSEGQSISSVLSELSKVNLTQKMELSKQTFYNGGQSLQFWSKTHSFVMYDKKKDYCKSKGAAVDKDRTISTASFLDDLFLFPEILKIETRLCAKRKMNEVLERVGFHPDPSFEDLFQKGLCQKVLIYYWQTLVSDKNQFIFTSSEGPQNYLRLLKSNRKDIGPKEALYMVGLISAAKDTGGVMELRKILDINIRSWYRITKDLAGFEFIQRNSQKWLSDIEQQLSDFNPVSLSGLRSIGQSRI